MNSLLKSTACLKLRKRLENAYDQNRLHEAIVLGDIMDEMQCLLILYGLEEAACQAEMNNRNTDEVSMFVKFAALA